MVGPDKSITKETLIQGVCARFAMERDEAKECIAKFWQALSSCVGQQVLDNARAKLPQEISELLAGKEIPVDEQQAQSQSSAEETLIDGTVADELENYQSGDFDATHSSGFSMPPQSIQQKLQKDWDHSRPT